MATLLSVNVGMPKDVPWRGRTVHTGVWKSPVAGPQMVRRLNIDGDGQGDLGGHGGEQRAVLVYQADSYRHWEEFFGRDLEYGVFGENFTVDGLGDDEVCIGDRYRIGEAEFEVTQPRVTCFRVAMRLEEPALPSLLVANHRPGFYLRVLREGHVRAGDSIVLSRRGPHSMTVAEIDALLYLPGHEADRLRSAVDIAALSPGWHQSFLDMLEPEQTAPAGVPTAPPPAWPGFRALTVVEVVVESASVTSFVLAGDRPLPAFEAGQYVTLRVAGAGDPAPVRSYSLSNVEIDGRYRMSVKREDRRGRQRLPALPRPARRPGRRRGAPWVVRARRRRGPRAADLRGHRAHAGPGDAAPARRRAQRPRGLVDPHHPRRPHAGVHRRGRGPPRPAAGGPVESSTTPGRTGRSRPTPASGSDA